MTTIDDCKHICNSVIGIQVLRYCFIDKINKSEAFSTFCSLFLKGKAAANPNEEAALSAHRSLFLILAGPSYSADHFTSSSISEIKLNYVDVASRLKDLGTIRPWVSFRSDDIFTLIVLMDCFCHGYISFEGFLLFVGDIVKVLRQIEDKTRTQEYINLAFSQACGIIRNRSINNTNNPIDQALERKLSRIASAARMVGLSPLATLCHIGARQNWVLNGTVVFSLISKLLPKITTNPDANRELENAEEITFSTTRLSVATPKKSAASLSSNPSSSDKGRRVASSPRGSVHSSPQKLLLAASGLSIASPSAVSSPSDKAPISPIKDPKISPNAKFAAYQNGDYSLSSLRVNNDEGSAFPSSQQEVNATVDESIPRLIQSLQATVSSVSSIVAQQTAQGTLTANTEVWNQLVSLEQQLSAAKDEAKVASSGAAAIVGTPEVPVSNIVAPLGVVTSRNQDFPHTTDNVLEISSSSSLAAGLTVSDLDVHNFAEQSHASNVRAVLSNGSSNRNASNSKLVAPRPRSSTPVPSWGVRVLKAKSSGDLLNGAGLGGSGGGRIRSQSVDNSRPQTPVVENKSNSQNADWSGGSGSVTLEVPPVGSLPGIIIADIPATAPPILDDSFSQRFDQDQDRVFAIENLYKDECLKAGRILQKMGRDTVGTQPVSRPSSRGRPQSSGNSGNSVSKELFGSSSHSLDKRSGHVRGQSPASRASSAGRARPGVSNEINRSHNGTGFAGSSSASSSQFRSRGRAEVDMSIFRSPATLRPTTNVNVFDASTLKWKPTVITNKYNTRFQNTQDLLLAEKLNSVFYS